MSIALFLTAGCAHHAHDPHDPLEGLNRGIYRFNEVVDNAILKPVAMVYDTVLPPPISKAVSHFFANFYMPLTVVNDVLQGEIRQAVADTWRFAINSTVGLAGTMDVASHWGLDPHESDFGVTVAKWGWHHSTYWVSPFFGPTTIRDTVMMPLNFLLTPWPYIKPLSVNLGMYAVYIVDQRAQLLVADELITDVAVDPYIFVRDAYLQHRDSLIDPEGSGIYDSEEMSEDELEAAFVG